jgi:predicted RNA methylase
LIDDAYFAGYSKSDIHKERLNDKVRMELYKKVIDLVCDEKKTVLDVGSGSGILSAFAVQKGAKEVIAIDNAETKKLWGQDFKKMVDLNQIKYIKNTIEGIDVDEIP